MPPMMRPTEMRFLLISGSTWIWGLFLPGTLIASLIRKTVRRSWDLIPVELNCANIHVISIFAIVWILQRHITAIVWILQHYSVPWVHSLAGNLTHQARQNLHVSSECAEFSLFHSTFAVAFSNHGFVSLRMEKKRKVKHPWYGTAGKWMKACLPITNWSLN